MLPINLVLVSKNPNMEIPELAWGSVNFTPIPRRILTLPCPTGHATPVFMAFRLLSPLVSEPEPTPLLGV